MFYGNMWAGSRLGAVEERVVVKNRPAAGDEALSKLHQSTGDRHERTPHCAMAMKSCLLHEHNERSYSRRTG